VSIDDSLSSTQSAPATLHDPAAAPSLAGGGATLLSVNVAMSEPLHIGPASAGTTVLSGIRKRPVSSLAQAAAVQVNRLGLDGDEQADLTVHGGLDKAVYLYPVEHYAWWRERRLEAGVAGADMPLAFGALGENLTTRGILEQDLWIGDLLIIGDVQLKVESPRNPCFKLNAVMGYARAAKHMLQSGFAGVYLRVVQTGAIRAGAAIELVPGRRSESIGGMLDWRRSRARREP
jgi:MOSC domain-containing protein YiiM